MSNKDQINYKLIQALSYATEILKTQNLSDWAVKINNKTTTLAETWHQEKIITFSKKFILMADKDQFKGVTLHEASHAITGCGHGHDCVFRRTYARTNNDVYYANKAIDMPIRKYKYTCPVCGYSGSDNKKAARYCSFCWKNSILSEMEVVKNDIKVLAW